MDSYGSNNARTAGENVQVLVRCRPLNDRELADKQTSVVRCQDRDKQVVVQPKGSKVPSKTFYFDSVFGPERTQRDLFQSSILPILDEVLNGYNCTIFAYGTTGTGKTFTMEGPPGSFVPLSASASASDRVKSEVEAGIIARSVQEIFSRLETCGLEYAVRVSHLELYNEEIRDLLSPATEPLKLLEDPRLGVQVHNLADLPVYNPQDIFNILERSYTERRTAETDYNKHSSRSHCVFSITIHIKESSTEGDDLIKVGKLNLVDLAGSENIGRSGADRDSMRKQEAGNINKSLLTLGRVITALTEGQMHIPYRESKLTRLLQDSLGGRTKTCIIATISPSSGNVEETMSTLEYAFRAKNIKNRPEVNQKMAKREVIKEYTSEINTLRAQLDCMRRKDGVYLPNEEYDRMIRESRELAEQVSAIEDALKVKERAFEELQELFDRKSVQAERAEKKLVETEGVLDKTRVDLASTTGELVATRIERDEQQYLVAEHERTEKTLGSEADGVLEELHTAIGDTEGLFAKISRKEGVHATNVDRTSELRMQMMTGLTQAEEELKRFTEGIGEALSTVASESENAHLIAQQSLQTSQKQLTTFHDDQCERMQQLADAAVKHTSANRKQLERMQKSTSKFIAAQQQMQAAHAQTRGNLWRNLNESHEAHAKQVEEWAMARLRACDDQTESMTAFAQKTMSALQAMDGKMTVFASGQSAALLAQEKMLETLAESQVSQLESFRSQLLASMTIALDAFVSRQSAEMNQALDQVRAQMMKGVQENDSQQAEYNRWTSGQVTAVDSFAESACTKYSETRRAVCDQVSAHEAFESEAKSSREAFELVLSKHASGEMAKTSEHANNVNTTVEEMLDSANNNEVEYETRVMDTNAAAAERKQMLSDGLSQLAAQVQVHTSTMTNMVGAIKEAVEAFQDESVVGTKEKKDRMATFELHPYIPTGVTPIKRQFKIPAQFTHTKPHMELLAEYRQQQGYEEVVQNAHDQKYLLPENRRPSTPGGSHASSLNTSVEGMPMLSHSGSSSQLFVPSPTHGAFSPSGASQSNDSDLPLSASNSSLGGNLNTSTGSVGRSNAGSAQPPRQTIQIINGRAIAPLPAPKAPVSTTSVRRTATTTTAKATQSARATAGAKKSSTIAQKRAPSATVHGPPLSEVNR